MARVSLYLHFPGNAEEAFFFYKSVFKSEFVGPIMRFGDLPKTASKRFWLVGGLRGGDAAVRHELDVPRPHSPLSIWQTLPSPLPPRQPARRRNPYMNR